MRQFMINQLRTLDVIDDKKLIEYVDYCLFKTQQEKIKFKTAQHHILPNAVFNQYTNLKEHKWNAVHLLHCDHYFAHWLFTQAINEKSQIFAFIGMHNRDLERGFITEEDLIDPVEFQKMNEKRSKLLSEMKMGSVGYWKGKKLPYTVWNKNKVGLQEAWNKGLPKENQPNYGRHLSDEHKKAISLANSGDDNYWRQNKQSESHRKKNSDANKRIIKTKEWNKKNSQKRTGTKLMSNGSIIKFVQPEDIDILISEGWVLGRINKVLNQ